MVNDLASLDEQALDLGCLQPKVITQLSYFPDDAWGYESLCGVKGGSWAASICRAIHIKIADFQIHLQSVPQSILIL